MTTNINFGALLSVSVVLMLLLYSFGFTGQRNAYAVGFFSKTDKPFGVSYDDWTSRYWNNSLAKNSDQATPKQNGCLLINNNNKSEPMAMLMETADVNFPPTQTCEISSSQGLVIPLWIGWCDTGAHKGASDALLTKCARQQNLGNIISDVKVDGIPVAKLNVRQSVVPGSGALDYKINSLNNVTESHFKGFCSCNTKRYS